MDSISSLDVYPAHALVGPLASTPFDFEGLEVRVITDERGNPWFVAADDVCGALDLGNTSQALTRLDEDEKGVITNEGLQTQGGRYYRHPWRASNQLVTRIPFHARELLWRKGLAPVT